MAAYSCSSFSVPLSRKILCWDKVDMARKIYDPAVSIIYTQFQPVFTSLLLFSFLIKSYSFQLSLAFS